MRATPNDLFEQSFQVVHVWIRAFLQDNRGRNRRGVHTVLGPPIVVVTTEKSEKSKGEKGARGIRGLNSNVMRRWQ